MGVKGRVRDCCCGVESVLDCMRVGIGVDCCSGRGVISTAGVAAEGGIFRPLGPGTLAGNASRAGPQEKPINAAEAGSLKMERPAFSFCAGGGKEGTGASSGSISSADIVEDWKKAEKENGCELFSDKDDASAGGA